MSTTPAKNYSLVSLTPAKHVFAGVNDTQQHRCQRHPTIPVSTTPNNTGVDDTGDAFPTGVVDTGDIMHHRCSWYRAVKIANFSGMHCRCHWHRWCTSRTFGGLPMPLKEQSVKKQAINRYYFSIASIQSSKESSNYNKIVCFAGVVDTGKAPEKLNISTNIRKKSKSLLGMSTGTRRSCLKKKTRGEKSRGTVPLIKRISPRVLTTEIYICVSLPKFLGHFLFKDTVLLLKTFYSLLMVYSWAGISTIGQYYENMLVVML